MPNHSSQSITFTGFSFNVARDTCGKVTCQRAFSTSSSTLFTPTSISSSSIQLSDWSQIHSRTQLYIYHVIRSLLYPLFVSSLGDLLAVADCFDPGSSISVPSSCTAIYLNLTDFTHTQTCEKSRFTRWPARTRLGWT